MHPAGNESAKPMKNLLSQAYFCPKTKELELPVKVQVKQAKSTCKNGVLQVILPKTEQGLKGEPINIE